MATYTANYGFIRPNRTEYYNIDDFNNNADKIDEEIKKVSDRIVNDNLLINGDFQVWQRGESFTVGIGYTYTADRFRIFTQGGADVEKDGDSLKVIPKAEGVNAVSVVLEAQSEWLGKTMTLSFEAKANSEIEDMQAIAWNGDNYTNPIKYYYYTVDTEFKRFSFAFTVPEILTDNKLHFWINRAVLKTLWLRRCKLEFGDVATPFVPRSYGEELALCQRYFYRLKRPNSIGNAIHLAQGITRTSTIGYVYKYFSVPMRVRPAVTISDSYDGVYLFDTTSRSDISSISTDSIGTECCGLAITMASEVLTPGNAVVLNCNNNATDFYIDFSAEL